MPEKNNNFGNIGPLPVLKPGTPIQHYEIIRKIGSGGMGDVYLAEDTRLKRQVAIKILSGSDVIAGDTEEEFLKYKP